MTAPASVVDKLVEEARRDLIVTYYETEYYHHISKPLLTDNVYARVFSEENAHLDEGFIHTMNSMHMKAYDNKNVLMYGDLGSIAEACWLTPEDCIGVYTGIKEKMKDYKEEL